jgi:hypothetical protein
MSFMQRELDRIAEALREAHPSSNSTERRTARLLIERIESERATHTQNEKARRIGRAHIGYVNDNITKRKAPNRCAWLGARSAFFARAHREGSRRGRTTSSARRGALPMKSDVDRFYSHKYASPPRISTEAPQKN